MCRRGGGGGYVCIVCPGPMVYVPLNCIKTLPAKKLSSLKAYFVHVYKCIID